MAEIACGEQGEIREKSRCLSRLNDLQQVLLHGKGKESDSL